MRQRTGPRRTVIVETGLEERAGAVLVDGRVTARTRHARTRFVDQRCEQPKTPRLPEIGDPWEPLTVRARLQRMAEVFRRIPHDPDTRPGGHRSCMPTPVREMFKDLPGEPMRVPVSRTDFTAAKQVLDSLITLTRDQRIVAWGIANNLGDRRVGRELGTHHHAAAKAKLALLAFLAADWNRRGWESEEQDVRAARDFIHRDID